MLLTPKPVIKGHKSKHGRVYKVAHQHPKTRMALGWSTPLPGGPVRLHRQQAPCPDQSRGREGLRVGPRTAETSASPYRTGDPAGGLTALSGLQVNWVPTATTHTLSRFRGRNPMLETALLPMRWALF